ncbi:MAG: pyrroline-5-carboxylate reductase [Chloroflexi bacterium]|nr:MAG: pyrroline-5-carboxylate reductase [Chloroflexota bacterium]RPI96737.1 MAG: pyrroline-5-carboxylate reductase [Chloroflexota bacterium]
MNTINKSLGFIGGGRITRIMLSGFARAGVLPQDIVVAEPNDDVFQKLVASVPSAQVIRADNKAAARQDIIFGALHPPAIPAVLAEIATALCPDAVFISLAPKATIASLSQGLQGFTRIVRLLPNAPSIIDKGYNPIAFSDGLSRSERSELLAFLQTLGECPEVPEDKIEAYAVLVAMGPTYFWFQWQQLMKLGVSFGMDQTEAGAALAAMLNGATATLFKGEMTSEEVMDLIPVKPLGEDEPAIRDIYTQRLEPLFKKLKS